jgi:hypothetical protein
MNQALAVCVDNSSYEASLERQKIYNCVFDSAAAKRRYVRVIDESGDDYLYPERCFLELESSPRSSCKR